MSTLWSWDASVLIAPTYPSAIAVPFESESQSQRDGWRFNDGNRVFTEHTRSFYAKDPIDRVRSFYDAEVGATQNGSLSYLRVPDGMRSETMRPGPYVYSVVLGRNDNSDLLGVQLRALETLARCHLGSQSSSVSRRTRQTRQPTTSPPCGTPSSSVGNRWGTTSNSRITCPRFMETSAAARRVALNRVLLQVSWYSDNCARVVLRVLQDLVFRRARPLRAGHPSTSRCLFRFTERTFVWLERP